jgi:hypothetical protein
MRARSSGTVEQGAPVQCAEGITRRECTRRCDAVYDAERFVKNLMLLIEIVRPVL